MNSPFLNFANIIQYKPKKSFQDAKILKVRLLEKDIFDVLIELPEIPLIEVMKEFISATLTQNKIPQIQVRIKTKDKTFTIKKLYNYIIYIINSFLKKISVSNQLSIEQFSNHEDIIIVEFKNNILEKEFLNEIRDIQTILEQFGFGAIKFRTHIKFASNLETNKKNSTYNNKKTKSFKDKKTVKIHVAKNMENQTVIVEGMIFNRKDKQTITGWNIIDLSITDFDDAVYVSIFVGNAKTAKKPNDKYKNFIPGTWVRVKGEIQLSAFKKNQYEIKMKEIKEIGSKEKIRKDTAENKRVELNVKTRMSTMDGIISANELVSRIKQWGHKAVSITDSESVQSLPEFFYAAKSQNIKAIYGSSFNIIERDGGIVKNANNKNLYDSTYIIFDLETTGLSPIFEDIIEFGATKIQSGKVIDKKHFFINTSKKLSAFTTKLTGITDDMLKNRISEKDAILKIKEYFGSNILVAHNANFDMGFINEKMEKYGYGKINWTVIDTLAASRFLEPTAKKFRLEHIAYRNGCTYNSEIAHRADYDADILANIWIRMLSKLREKNINKVENLANCINESIYNFQYTKEISMIAINNKGLKELFELTSLTHTKQFYKSPRLFWDQLPKSKNILIGSGGLKSSLVDLMLTGTTKQIKNQISKYDYIEIQPPRNYSHLISRGNISEVNLKKSIEFIIREAKKQGKIVVATGDVRYLDDQDSVYHSVYINAKGLGGSRHYLFKYNESQPKYPIQSLLTTQEMIDQFKFLNDPLLVDEIVVKNTNKIADMIEPCKVIKDKLYPPKINNTDKKISDLILIKAKERYGEVLPGIIKKRIDKELSNIIKHGYDVIYYIAYKLVKKSLDDGYLVGSRGSVGSSIVATFLGITEVNPLPPHYICKKCKYSNFDVDLKYSCGYDLPENKCPKCSEQLDKDGHNIPFETFLGLEANKVPDIDLNFSGDYQPIIHKEVEKEFGSSHVFRAGTISTVAEKTAYGYVMSWAEETGRSISKLFIEFMAKKVAGTKRTTGQHPGGIIVIPKNFDVEDFSPINYPANDVDSNLKTTHFDFHAIHNNVLKLDLLAHDDPTAIKMLQKLTGINPKAIPYSDKRVLSLFSSTKELGITKNDILGERTGVMGIPEFGTPFVRGMLKSVNVSSFADLVSISGLSHGTDVWTNNGEEIIKKQNKKISDLISCRDDIMINLLSKGMNYLESFEIMEQVRKGKSINSKQEANMKELKVEDWYIDSCKKIKYMFPKSHATAYVQMAWRIAWFKLYYPLAYYATFFTIRASVNDIETLSSGKDAIINKLTDLKARRYNRGDQALTNKEVNLIPVLELGQELFARGFYVSNINIEKSLSHEWLIDKDTKTIIPSFSSLEGLGDAVANSIIKARNEKKFSSIKDLQKRTLLNKTIIEKLKKMKVLESMDETNQLTLF